MNTCAIKAAFLISLLVLPSLARAEFGDVDFTYNVYTKHINDREYFTRDEGYKKYVEDNNHMGIRLGIDEYRSIGASYGTNSFGKPSWVFAGELMYPFHRNFKAGVMAGVANGYEQLSNNGWTFVAGPSIRLLTPYIGATATLYAADALVITVDVPISTHLR